MIEIAAQDHPTGSTIPTLDDMMAQIEQRFLDGVAQGQMHEDIADSIAQAMTGGTNGDLFPFLAFARGCHAAAEAHRQAGNAKTGEFLHSLGQHMISMAVATVADLVVVDIHLSGIARH